MARLFITVYHIVYGYQTVYGYSLNKYFARKYGVVEGFCFISRFIIILCVSGKPSCGSGGWVLQRKRRGVQRILHLWCRGRPRWGQRTQQCAVSCSSIISSLIVAGRLIKCNFTVLLSDATRPHFQVNCLSLTFFAVEMKSRVKIIDFPSFIKYFCL